MKRYEIVRLRNDQCNFIERAGDKECGSVADVAVFEIDGDRRERIGKYCYKHAQTVRRDFERAELERTRAERNPENAG